MNDPKVLPPPDARKEASLHTAATPTIHITNEVHPPVQSDLDVRAKGISPALARRVCLEAGGRVVGKRVLVPTGDLCAYLRAHPPKPRAPRAVRTVPANDGGSIEGIVQANGMRVVGGKGSR